MRFIPGANTDKSAGFTDTLQKQIEGVVVEVNEKRRWARVRYETPQGPGYECFKF